MNLSSSKSMYNDTIWGDRGNGEICIANAVQIHKMLGNSRKDVGHFWCLDAKRNSIEPILTHLTENGTGLLNA